MVLNFRDPLPEILADRPPLPGARVYRAVAKLRMLHAPHRTIILPEFVFVMDGQRFVVPTDFTAPLLNFLEADNCLTLGFSSKSEARFVFRTTSSQHVGVLPDGAHLFRGELAGPRPLTPWVAGRSRWSEGRSSFDLLLHHHTTPAAKAQICASGSLRASVWNYQGTRKLENTSFAYLTTRRRIDSEAALQAIGMASQGKLYLRCDDGPSGYGQVCEFPVYRDSTRNRSARIELWTPAEQLAPQHIIAHAPPGEPVFYEIGAPEVLRVAMVPGACATLTGNVLSVAVAVEKRMQHVVIADATDPTTIGACLQEEETERIFKFERSPELDLLSFWRDNRNSELFSGAVADLDTLS